MGYNKCCVPGCKNTRQDALLHKFPTCESRRIKWLDSMNCTSLRALSVAELSKQCVCHKHFEARFLTQKSRLLMQAYPTLFTELQTSTGVATHYNSEKSSSFEHNYCRTLHVDHNYAASRPTQSVPSSAPLVNANINVMQQALSYPSVMEIDYSASDCVTTGTDITQNDYGSTSTVCEVPTPTIRAPEQPEFKPAQSSLFEPKPELSGPPEEVDPLSLDMKLEDDTSDSDSQCAEEPVYEELIYEETNEKFTAVPLDSENIDASRPGAYIHAPILRGVSTSNTANIVSQTRAATSLLLGPPKQLCGIAPKEIQGTIPLSVIQRLKLAHQKDVQTEAQLQEIAGYPSLTNLPHNIDSIRLLTELDICKNENLALRKELSKLRKRKRALESRVKNLKRYRSDKKAMFDKLTAKMSAPAKALFEMQLQSKKKKGRRYSLPGRIIALSIYKASPLCYMLLSKYFVLPSVTILKRFVTSVKDATETNAAKETELENDENQDTMLSISDKMDSIDDDLDLNDYSINNSFQQEIDETSLAINSILNKIQIINNGLQSSQAAEAIHQTTDDSSEVQSVELSEGQALQLPDGRIFQLINGQIIELESTLQQDKSDPQRGETQLIGLSDELNPTVNDPHSTQEYDQGSIMVKPLLGDSSIHSKIALLSETPLPQETIPSPLQKINENYQRKV